MAEPPDGWTAELVAGVDIMSLPLAPHEGFVLSRIQGRTRLGEIAALAGLPRAQLGDILAKLVSLGAVQLRDEQGQPRQLAPAAPSQPPPRARKTTSGRARAVRSSRRPRPMLAESGISQAPPSRSSTRPVTGRSPGRSSSSPPSAPVGGAPSAPSGGSDASARAGRAAAPPPPPTTPAAPAPEPAPGYDPALLDEDVDLPRERRRQLLDLEHKLADCTHYEALGVAQEASRKEIRSAYFALSKTFHPDTMFRRNLGSFKPRMEFVFQRLTEAYEILSRKPARDDYDAYLRATQGTQKSEASLRKAAQSGALPQSMLEPLGEPEEDATTGVPPSPSPPPATSSAPTERGRELARHSVSRRLSQLGSTMAGMRSSAPPASESDAAARRSERLRGLASSLVEAGRFTSDTSDVSRRVALAREAEAAGDLTAAEEHLRRALKLSPEHLKLKQEHVRVAGQLAAQLAEDYAARAELEEKQGKWASAALSWSKVFAGRPENAVAARRTAHAMMKAGGDVRRAHHYAQKAVLLEGGDVRNRITLAQVMMHIGLLKGARRELDAARRLDPGNEIVKNLLAELKA